MLHGKEKSDTYPSLSFSHLILHVWLCCPRLLCEGVSFAQRVRTQEMDSSFVTRYLILLTVSWQICEPVHRKGDT